jgi:PDZ domain
MAALCVTGSVRAQDFQIGGDEQRETSAPLEVRPSLGVFVLGYVNGRGPYRFSLSLIWHTQLTSTVVMDAGLATRDRGVMADGNSNHYEQDRTLTDATLRLGDRELSLNGAHVFPDDDLSSYAPVSNYGGILGVELFRKGIVSLDLSHARLVLSPSADRVQAPDAIELPLEQSARGAELDRLPAVTLSLDGRPGRFRMIFSATSVSFQQDSPLGRDLLDKSPHPLTSREWTPNGIIRSQSGATAVLGIGDQQGGAAVGISRNMDTLPLPIRSSWRTNLSVRESPVDGVVGSRALGAFDITIDDQGGKMWLTRRDKSSFRCSGVSQGSLRGTTGFSPWVYKGQGVVGVVTDGSPADAAGIEPGDRIISINDGDVPAYYDHLDATCLAPEILKVVFRNASGDHTVTLTPAMQ